jgi:hypothetical protein
MIAASLLAFTPRLQAYSTVCLMPGRLNPLERGELLEKSGAHMTRIIFTPTKQVSQS